MLKTIPSFSYEYLFEEQGYTLIAGVDEVGRAPLAGPVAAGAVILDISAHDGWLEEVRDSKLLSARTRQKLESVIQREAIAWGVGMVSNADIDDFGISRATRLAMKKAIGQLVIEPQAILIDYIRLPEVNLPQMGITHGDSLSFSIACASIIAKVARDRLMEEMDERYPGYGFSRNKGYPTREHLCSLENIGPCPIHRLSFHPLKPQLGINDDF